MKFKQNSIVIFNTIAQSTFRLVDSAYQLAANREALLTAGINGDHGENSLHYQGLAWDFRLNDVKNKDLLFATLRAELPQALYDVVWEGRGEKWEHLHVEYDVKPKR